MLVIWGESGREMNGKLPLTLLVATEYLVMPFGLSNSLAVFQALVNDTLRDMLNQLVFVYLNNILIFSKTLPEHILHVLQVLIEKIEKCECPKSLSWATLSLPPSSNFYSHFIRKFHGPKSHTHFGWTPEADRAFMELKGRFTSGLILVHPDPTHPFMVEVDASDTGAGAVLSQRNERNKGDRRMHPSAFLCK
jgi:hypothetical protein